LRLTQKAGAALSERMDTMGLTAFTHKLSVLPIMLILALASCMDEPPKQFSKNNPIPLGANTVKVSRIEVGIIESGLGQFAQSSPQLAGLTKSGKKSVGVFLEIAGIRASDAAERKKDRDTITPRGEVLTLVGKAAEKFDSIGVFPEYILLYKDPAAAVDQMLNMSEDTLSPRKYVALFVVPKESSEFTLLVRNPSMKEGQPRIASVALVK
jgi:hypothetical protein